MSAQAASGRHSERHGGRHSGRHSGSAVIQTAGLGKRYGQNWALRDCTVALPQGRVIGLIAYQPASRFWAFQWYETGIFLAAAVMLAGFCLWWVRRRRLS